MADHLRNNIESEPSPQSADFPQTVYRICSYGVFQTGGALVKYSFLLVRVPSQSFFTEGWQSTAAGWQHV